jgi:hypothetical protein
MLSLSGVHNFHLRSHGSVSLTPSDGFVFKNRIFAEKVLNIVS